MEGIHLSRRRVMNCLWDDLLMRKSDDMFRGLLAIMSLPKQLPFVRGLHAVSMCMCD